MTYHYAARGGPSHGHAQKIGEDRTCSAENMIADKHTQRDTQTETDRQTDTLSRILRSPSSLIFRSCIDSRPAGGHCGRLGGGYIHWSGYKVDVLARPVGRGRTTTDHRSVTLLMRSGAPLPWASTPLEHWGRGGRRSSAEDARIE